MTLARAAMAMAMVVLLAACGGGDGGAGDATRALSWAEFRALAHQEPDTGVFITNGDELAETEDDLRAAYARYRGEVDAAAEGLASGPLIVNVLRNGSDDRWPSSQALSLTYCVSQRDFGSRYAQVVAAMDDAAGAWEATANVNFVHDASQDGSCTSRNPAVVFDVRSTRSIQYLARAFFPSSSRRNREIVISTSSFGNIDPWTLAGVLRHELGHTIGFRHEHTRPEAGTCFEDTSWRALTVYDSSSVMHYPQCNGTQDGDLVLTNLDRTGASTLYPRQ